MTKPQISRRDFIKLAGAGAATSAILTGCGPASRYVTREPYTKMPEYTYNGESTFFATTCQECAAGCGIVVRTFQGRAIKVEGNPHHPVNAGKTCARGQASLQGLYNPDRVQSPIHQQRKPSLGEDILTWDDAITQLTASINQYKPEEIAFILGETSDHIFDLASEFSSALGANDPVRFSALNLFEARNTLIKVANQFYGAESLPFFDIANADLLLSFGASFLETWISPVSFTGQFAAFRKGKNGKRGFMVHFEPRMSQTAALADIWVPIIPGTEAFAALALGRMAAEKLGILPKEYADVDTAHFAEIAGVEMSTLQEISDKIVLAEAPLALPGNWALGQEHGNENASAIFLLNYLTQNAGKQNNLYLPPASSLPSEQQQSKSLEELETLIGKMSAGEIKLLLVHGVNPVFDIPQSFGFSTALDQVETVIAFSSFPDETALMADYILPDHTSLEAWGYQSIPTGTQQQALSGAQPVVVPFYDTRATGDVLLAVAQNLGGTVAEALPFEDEVAFIESKLSSLLGEESKLIRAGDIKTFMAQFQQYGGWWAADISTLAPTEVNPQAVTPTEPVYQGEGEFHLVPFVSPILGEKGANKPWLQETPDPTTTVMWNTWIEVNPHTAEELGLHDDDIVKVISPQGEIEAAVYLYPAIRPDTIAIPFGQGHTAYGRYAENRGANPANLLGKHLNADGDFVFATTKVRIEKTGKYKQLARLESRIGVYGLEE
ncbi:molybdopterin-dependent oxidoreductase [bacterium]|nr:molybdopterin-dependent oxidoreductase [bacterium]